MAIRTRIGADTSIEFVLLVEAVASDLSIEYKRRVTVREVIIRGLAHAYPERIAIQAKKELKRRERQEAMSHR